VDARDKRGHDVATLCLVARDCFVALTRASR
jgi:hypothetical protein